jgi:diadenosine tetraphosphate (Ap4A) HIT family hydrolase
VTGSGSTTAIHRRVERCRSGDDPTLIGRMRSGWAVMGDPQVLSGYCLLLPDPVVSDLNALHGEELQAFLADLASLGAAVLAETRALRINYAIFGNLEPALHAHVLPRHADEPAEMRTAQPWAYDWTRARAFDQAVDGELLQRLRERLFAGARDAGLESARTP